MRRYLRIVRGGERRGGGCEEGDERIVRRGALEREPVRFVAGVHVVVGAADPGDPGGLRTGDGDGRVGARGGARYGSIPTARGDAGEELEGHAWARSHPFDHESRVVEALHGGGVDARLRGKRVGEGERGESGAVGGIDVLDTCLGWVRAESLATTRIQLVPGGGSGEWRDVPEERSTRLGPRSSLHSVIEVEPPEEVSRAAGQVQGRNEISRAGERAWMSTS